MSLEKEQLQNVISGSAGGGLGPYPPLLSTTENDPLPAPSLSYSHRRFSTLSSYSSVLGFSTDSKYAAPYLSYNPKPLSESPVLVAAMYGVYDRIDGPSDEDDFIHDPNGRKIEVGCFDQRGIVNLGVVVTIIVALILLFLGYPLIWHFTRNLSLWEQVVLNGTGQIPNLPLLPRMIDPDTPEDVYTRTGFDGQEYELVFSDEFETPGRSFYPGDDPFWEAVDLWYYATADMEWYDPGQVTTRDGHLVIVIEESNDHPGLPFKSGMVQTWNKFCFTTGYIEVSVVFPGSANISGYWPGAWTMGNLGRPGYGATAEGLWPYTYNSCDVGTLANQTLNGQPAAAATAGGNPKYNHNLSWLPGQRLSACTCQGEDHPGPTTSTGRGAPEIDVFEAQKNKQGPGGRVTQSVQMAPFSTLYYFPNSSADVTIPHPERTVLNSYRGSALQQAVSALTDLNSTVFAEGGSQFTTFAFEYWSNPSSREEGYITWVADEMVFSIDSHVFTGDTNVGISDRLIAEEPMAIVLNLAVSQSFQTVDLSAMIFPAEYRIDYVRVWQRKGLGSEYSTCDPNNYPTANYINGHMNAYSNPNLTSWKQAGYTSPKNSLIDTC